MGIDHARGRRVKYTYILREPSQAHKLILEVLWPAVKGWLIGNGAPLEVNVRLLKRSSQQNRYAHKLFSLIAASGLEFAGKKRSAAAWKVLLVSGHTKATGMESEIVPGLEGEFVNIRESTALMSKARSSSLIEYTTCYMVQNGIPVPAMEGDE